MFVQPMVIWGMLYEIVLNHISSSVISQPPFTYKNHAEVLRHVLHRGNQGAALLIPDMGGSWETHGEQQIAGIHGCE